jgi:hypothetical protein
MSQSLAAMVTHRGRPAIDPMKIVEENEALYKHALAYPQKVAAKINKSEDIANASNYVDVHGAPPEYNSAFAPVASFIRDKTWEGARFQADLTHTNDLDTVAHGSFRAYMSLTGGKSAFTTLGIQRTSTGERASAEMRPDGRLHCDLGGKITPDLAGSLNFVVDSDSVTERATVSVRHTTPDSTLAVSAGKTFLGPVTAAASYVQRYGKSWLLGAKTEYDSSKHPHTQHEVTVATYRVARNTPFVGLDNVYRLPPADGAMLRVAADHCAVTYHRRVNHALTYEAEFMLGQRSGSMESVTKTGVRWMSTFSTFRYPIFCCARCFAFLTTSPFAAPSPPARAQPPRVPSP